MERETKMFWRKKALQWILLGFFMLVAITLINTSLVQSAPLLLPVLGDNWIAIPPYNLLWPLWSPPLSPVDSVTGIATPLLNELTNATILPVQPALFWDPARLYAFALYNIPAAFGSGLTAFDPYYGLNPWPPSYLVDPTTGAPAPVTLPLGFQLFPPLGISNDYTWGNILYALQYPSVDITTLLTPAQLWGLAPW
jgi:hypothetical protein